ncbi:MAG: aldo/keto reductase [Pseudomonadota bacterium]
MRYRPFGKSGQIVSAVSLLLDSGHRRSARDWRSLVASAMGHGVNCFELVGSGQALVDGFGEAVADVERELLFVAWRPAAFTAEPADQVEAFLARTGLDYLDLLDFEFALPQAEALARLRQARRISGLCLSTDDEETDAQVARGGFHALSAVFTPLSGWKERNRIKAAAARDMAVIARDIWPEPMRPGAASPGGRPLFRRKPDPLTSLVGGFRFLENTAGWTAEELCLAYVLTEPAITTVMVEVEGAQHLARLAEAPDRDLPTGVAAQIEMARFSPVDGRGAARG